VINPETKYSELNYSLFLVEEKEKVIRFNRPTNNELFLIYNIVGNFLIDREDLRNIQDENYGKFIEVKKFSDELLKYILLEGPKDLKLLEADLIKINARFAYIRDYFNSDLKIEFYEVFKELASLMIKFGERKRKIK